MNKSEGKRMNDIFYKYYHGREITEDDLGDMDMLHKLSRTGHIVYKYEDGKAFAEATERSKRAHYCPKPSAEKRTWWKRK